MNAAVLRRPLVALGFAGVAIAGYLTWVHYGGVEPLCFAGGACARVQTSEYADLVGVPVALIGLLGYLAIVASLRVPGERGVVAGAFLALIGFGFSAYLTWAELLQIHAICQWCVASAANMTLITGLAVARLLRA